MSKISNWLIQTMISCSLTSTMAFAQTYDGLPPPRENACEEAGLAGNLLGLCRAYWEANDCDVLSSPSNNKSCDVIASNFARLSGGLDIKDIFLSSGSAVINPEGGEINLHGVAKIIFPTGAFPTDTQVTITTSSTDEVAAAFTNFTGIFRPANRLAYEIRIATGALPPVSDTILVEILVPDDFFNAVPTDHQIELFAQLLSDGGEETIDLFELFDATFDASTKTIIAELPTSLFSDTRNSAGDFEAIITLAPTPGINRTVPIISPLSSNTVLGSSISAAATTSECKAASIQCPLSIGCTMTSQFNPAREHPVAGGG